MAQIRRFEDIEAWQHARELTRSVYRISGTGAFGQDYSLRNQIRRAAVSIMANIAEGYERDGNEEFVQFLYIAKASAGEVRSHLYVALDQEYLTREEFTQLAEQAKRISMMIHGLIKALSASEYRGVKYKP